MAMAGHQFWVALVDGAVTGYEYAIIAVEAETSWRYATTVVSLDQMGVSAEHRGLGVGTALVGAVRRAAERCGAREVRLNVWAFNAEARAFYARCGFAVVQERRWLPITPATENDRAGDADGSR
jgi:ribosomal protein S18 acetylase RimI-like enzyme